MIVLTHAYRNPSDSNNPSIACVVASYDRHCARYATELCYQASRMEYISQFEEMMLSLLDFFRAKNGLLPKRILIYRDGVSQGQFGPVKAQELAAVKRGCRLCCVFEAFGGKMLSVCPVIWGKDALNHSRYRTYSYKPYWLVQKRHHTRFFPTRSGQTDRSGNCMAGTVIDTIITHPTEFDF
ncbi:Piwi domain-containing protein, partial [Endogone sp. FLAS-F59071]